MTGTAGAPTPQTGCRERVSPDLPGGPAFGLPVEGSLVGVALVARRGVELEAPAALGSPAGRLSGA